MNTITTYNTYALPNGMYCVQSKSTLNGSPVSLITNGSGRVSQPLGSDQGRGVVRISRDYATLAEAEAFLSSLQVAISSMAGA
jgi:hypothetical protein